MKNTSPRKILSPTIYFAGQDNFGNRGCEALIRASVKTIRSEIPKAQFLVPAKDIGRDAAQWGNAKEMGVTFIAAEPIPSAIRWWGRARRVLGKLEHYPPSYRLTKHSRDALMRSDVLVMTGGDIISLDYGLESLYYWTRICESAMDMGKRTVLWAASVGPFTTIPSAELQMLKFLKRFDLITVRETSSLRYLTTLGVPNVQLVTDPAFVLDCDNLPKSSLPKLCSAEKKIFGFNVSPLIRKFRANEENQSALDSEISEFLAITLRTRDINILLIPHVDPLNGTADNSDLHYMSRILKNVHAKGFDEDRIAILPPSLNTAQLKGVIQCCAYFMGARTHATVAALSQGVPTTSIAYSIKAKGINQDLFGHLRYVLETPEVSQASLTAHLNILITERDAIIQQLADRIPVWQNNAYLSAQALKTMLACDS